MEIQTALKEMIERADRAAANDLLEDWAKVHGYDKMISELLEPVISDFGRRWEQEGMSLAQSYVMVKIVGDFMTKCAAEQASTRSETDVKDPAVLGNIEDDFHALGRQMVTTFLEADGWKMCDLGNDVLAGEFVDKAEDVGAKVIGASAMMYSTASNITSLRKEIDRRGLAGKVQLAVGGAVFVLRPELVEEVGGDGTARNAIGAPGLFSRLWEKACQRSCV